MKRVGLWMGLGVMGLLLGGGVVRMCAQASAIPSAQTGAEEVGGNRGRKLLDEMVKALGGDAWLNRKDWTMEGSLATFYQGRPHEGVAQFVEYYRPRPFGERVVIVTKIGVFIPTAHRDVAEVWTPEGGYEITYKGKKALPKLEVDEYQRRRQHSLDTVMNEWLKQPGVIVTYEGTTMVGRRLADRVSVLTATNDAVTLELDEGTHLPLSRTFEWRDATYQDLDKDVEQYDAYQPMQGIMTPMTITRVRNDEMVAQRFLTKVTYNNKLPADLFDPDRPLAAKTK